MAAHKAGGWIECGHCRQMIVATKQGMHDVLMHPSEVPSLDGQNVFGHLWAVREGTKDLKCVDCGKWFSQTWGKEECRGMPGEYDEEHEGPA